jgi:hypothetical protein
LTARTRKNQAVLTEKLANLSFSGNTVKNQIRQFVEAVEALGHQAHIGWILHAGAVSDGTFQVQFNITGNGYSSRWPEWAYAPARDALLHGKKLLVISDGVPFGMNLLQVLILNRDA